MTYRIEEKIVKVAVKTPEEPAGADAPPAPARAAEPEALPRADVIQMHERLERPEVLLGTTYKIKTPLSEHALYVTINDIVLNAGTEHEQRRPFEIFINSKNMEHFQWIVALTRIISAVFRKGGDVTFLVEELRSVFDPRGGYFKRGGRYMPSLVAEIGDAIEAHLVSIGLLRREGLDPRQQQHVEEKKAELRARAAQAPGTGERTGEASGGATGDMPAPDAGEEGDLPPGATLCMKCHTRAVVMLDGCMTCLSCGDSKCG